MTEAPEPPYFAVIFSSRRTPGDAGYDRMSERMLALALAQPGCLGAESARGSDGFGITVSYWASEADICAWKAVAAHETAQRIGLSHWYAHYKVQVARVERSYSSQTTALARLAPDGGRRPKETP